MDVILFEPEIPPNTGNIARLCAAFQVALHLVEPLGFKLDDRHLKRAGLDYWPHVSMRVWPDWNSFAEYFSSTSTGRLIMATTKGQIRLPDFRFMADDALIFGPETRGLPPEILILSPWLIRIPTMPMDEGGVRSLNLSTAAGIFLFTAMNSSGLLNHLP